MAHTLLRGERPGRRQTNRIYDLLNKQFVRIFDDFDGDPMIESCYVPELAPDADGLREIYGAAIVDDPLFSTIAKDVLTFAAIEDTSTLVLSGPVGSGKTAALRSVERLVRKHSPLKQRVQLLRINLNAAKSDLEEAAANGPVELQAALRQSVMRKIRERLDVVVDEKEAFYKHAWQHDQWFMGYRSICTEVHMPTAEERREYRTARLKEYVDTKDFVYHMARYALTELDVVMVMVLDNLDPLDRVAHEALLWMAEELRERGRFRIVLSMRDNTRAAMGVTIDALAPLSVNVREPNIARILEKRAAFLLDDCKSPKTKQGIEAKLTDYGLTGIATDELVQLFIEAALPDAVLEDLSRFSNHNARMALDMVRTHFASPYIQSERLAGIMRVLHEDHHRLHEPELPAHLFVQSVVTENRDTFGDDSTFDTVVNVWGDQFEQGTHASQFCGLLLLNAIQRAQSPITLGSIRDTFDMTFHGNSQLGEEYDEVLERWMVRLVNGRLVQTPEFLSAARHHRLKDHSELVLSLCGRFYLEELAYRLEYFGYMKDSLPTRVRVQAISSKVRPFFTQRLENSLLMIQYLLDEEVQWYQQIKGDPQDWANFVDRLVFRSPEDDVPELIAHRFVRCFGRLKMDHPRYFTVLAGKRLGQVQAQADREAARLFDEP